MFSRFCVHRRDDRTPEPTVAQVLKELLLGTALFVGGIIVAGVLSMALLPSPSDAWWGRVVYGFLLGICLVPALWYAGKIRDRASACKLVVGLSLLAGLMTLIVEAVGRYELPVDTYMGWLLLLGIVVSDRIRHLFGTDDAEEDRHARSITPRQFVFAALAGLGAVAMAELVLDLRPMVYVPWSVIVGLIAFDMTSESAPEKPVPPTPPQSPRR